MTVHHGQWLTRSQAAALAGVSIATIGRWMVEGVIPQSALLSVGRTRVRYSRHWIQGSAPRADGVVIPARDQRREVVDVG